MRGAAHVFLERRPVAPPADHDDFACIAIALPDLKVLGGRSYVRGPVRLSKSSGSGGGGHSFAGRQRRELLEPEAHSPLHCSQGHVRVPSDLELGQSTEVGELDRFAL